MILINHVFSIEAKTNINISALTNVFNDELHILTNGHRHDLNAR